MEGKRKEVEGREGRGKEGEKKGSLSENQSTCNAGDIGVQSSIPGSGRCPGGGHGRHSL